MFSEKLSILIIDDNNAPFILPLIRSFSGIPDLQLDVLVYSNMKPQLFRYSRYIRKVYYSRGDIHEDFETVLRDTLEKSKAGMIIPTREWIWKLIAENQQWLRKIVRIHPFPDTVTLGTVTDKWKLNHWLANNHFPSSRTLPVEGNTVDGSKTADFPFPALLKPRYGAGGIGIKPVNDPEELVKALSGNDNYSTGYFLQEQIEGYDIDMSLFAVNGEIHFYTIQRGIIAGSFVFPKGIELIKNQDLYELGRDIIEKLNYTGIAHLDFRFDAAKKQYILVDFNARYWNSLLGSSIMGVNFPLLVTAYTLGKEFDRPEYSNGFFYYGTATIKQIFRNFNPNTRHPVSLKNSQLSTIIRDPLPELFYFLKFLLKPFRIIFRRD